MKPFSSLLLELATISIFNCQLYVILNLFCSSRHIDSRSLQRLGVYVPRENVGATFINPGGISPPPSKMRYGIIQVLIFVICDCCMYIVNEALVPELFTMPMPYGNSDVASLSNSSLNNVISESSHDEVDRRRSFVSKKGDKGIAMSSKSEGDVQNLKGIRNKSNVHASSSRSDENLLHAPNNTPVHVASLSQQVNDMNEELHVSVEAQHLANEIIHESLSTLIDDLSTTDLNANEIIENVQELQEISQQHCTDGSDNVVNDATNSIISNTTVYNKIEDKPNYINEDTSIIKTSSTLFVDMTRLQKDDD